MKISTTTDLLRKRFEILDTQFANGPSSTNLYEAVSNSPFYCLPSELRNLILHLAFGDQTILIKSFGDVDKAWRWRNYVYSPAPPFSKQGYELCGRVLDRPLNDSGYDMPEPKPLGIMGWLYSCRLGYFEAVDILLSTNTFHTRCEELYKNFFLVFPRRYMKRITKLELPAEFDLVNWLNHDTVERGPGFLELEAFLVRLLGSSISLKALYLSLERISSGEDPLLEYPYDFAYPSRAHDIAAEAVQLVDNIVTRQPPTLSVELGIPWTYHRKLRYKAEGQMRIQVSGEYDDHVPLGNYFVD